MLQKTKVTLAEYKSLDPKPKRTRKHLEHKLQTELVAKVRQLFDGIIYVDGSDVTSNSARQGGKHKALGYSKGWADLRFYDIRVGMAKPTLFIELKTKIGREDKEQVKIKNVYLKAGYTWEVVRDVETAIDVIKQHFKL